MKILCHFMMCKWMHIADTGNVVLTDVDVFKMNDHDNMADEICKATICMSGFDLKIPPADTLVHLRGSA